MDAAILPRRPAVQERRLRLQRSRAPSNDFPLEAGSWGGVVRSGPGREFSRLGSLAEGERITLIENTGVWTMTIAWFKIRYRGNRDGYQWGGIVCGLDKPIDGAFETCR